MIVQHVNEAQNETQLMKKPNLPVYFDLYFSYPIMYLLCGRGVVWNAINKFIIIIIIIQLILEHLRLKDVKLKPLQCAIATHH
jgi:hypothetical protein